MLLIREKHREHNNITRHIINYNNVMVLHVILCILIVTTFLYRTYYYIILGNKTRV